MTVLRFAAKCQNGHELVEFTDRAVFDGHMATEHHKKKIAAGAEPGNRAPGWSGGKIQAPTPWKAPAVPKDWEGALARLIASSGGDAEMIDGDAPALGQYTNSPAFEAQHKVQGNEVPVAALPPTVASIMTAVAARGEVWLVTLKEGGDAFLQMAVEQSTDAMTATIRLRAGKVHLVEGRHIVPDSGPYNRTVTLAQVRSAFGPKAVRPEKVAELVAA